MVDFLVGLDLLHGIHGLLADAALLRVAHIIRRLIETGGGREQAISDVLLGWRCSGFGGSGGGGRVVVL